MPWMVAWKDGRSSGPYETEWEAERHGCMESRMGARGSFRAVDLAPPAGLMHRMLDPRTSAQDWVKVAEYLSSRCDRFWLHWWFRPVNDTRSLWDRLSNVGDASPPEPLPPREAFCLGRLESAVDSLEHSWICPNGVAATGRLKRDTMSLLLKQEDVKWWDLHLYDGGRMRFVATDGGSEHFAWVTAQDVEAMASAGIPPALFRDR